MRCAEKEKERREDGEEVEPEHGDGFNHKRKSGLSDDSMADQFHQGRKHAEKLVYTIKCIFIWSIDLT